MVLSTLRQASVDARLEGTTMRRYRIDIAAMYFCTMGVAMNWYAFRSFARAVGRVFALGVPRDVFSGSALLGLGAIEFGLGCGIFWLARCTHVSGRELGRVDR
jgi:hypothetical protein